MSAIAGILSLNRTPVEAEPAERMARGLGWRGPDDDGSYRSPDGRVALACHRLAAADGPDAAMPMANETHDVWMVLDGEILNHRALRHSLDLAGHRFRSGADAEAALHAYEQWDLDFARHLQGPFAIALWDDRRDRLVLARDRLGRKPLYFGSRRGRLAFASGIAPVVTELGLPRLLDPAGLAHYLSFGCVPAPRSIAHGIAKLAPGEMLVADRDAPPRLLAWGSLAPDERRARVVRALPLERHAGNVRTLLECSVADRMASPDGVGVFLDGGGGSGAVAAIAGRLAGHPAQAVAVVDSDARDGEVARDVRHIAAAARADLAEIAVSADDATDALRPLAAALPEPVADEAGLAGWFAARAGLQAGMATLLSAEGADEILLGKPAYRGMRQSGLLHRLGVLVPWLAPLMARALAARATRSEGALPPDLTPFGEDEWSPVLGNGGVVHRPPPTPPALRPWTEGDRLEGLGLRDLGWRVADGVTLRADAAAQAHGLEARLPFLDEQFAAYALCIPGALRSPAGAPRLILKRALGDLLPPGMAARQHVPAPLPLAPWMTGTLGTALAEALGTSGLVRAGVIAPEPVRALLARHRAEGGRAGGLWALSVLLAWADVHGFDGLAPVEADKDAFPTLADHSRS